VERVEVLPLDTYALASALFSHRRSVHESAGDYGRNCSAIVLG
jgi:copper oxidase (laccase) domain-containing protein